jgi:T-complex protein 1 subunit eta
VADEDLRRVAEAAGARVQTTVNALEPSVLGSCARFEERQVGAERFNIFTGARSRLLLKCFMLFLCVCLVAANGP